jgi:peptide methionine sulfoxide reductase MsrA
MGDHTESLKIEFDPDTISYADLVDLFWTSHNPRSRTWSRQYQSILFTHNPEQARIAEHSRNRLAEQLNQAVQTEIKSAGIFYTAEAYHQKYRLRNNKVIHAEFARMYPRDEDLMRSTAAARVNGYLAGYGSLKDLQKELPSLGLSADARQRLLMKITG